MIFSELKTELADRGFDDLTPTRQARLINVARAELDRIYLWPWREAAVTGTSPLEIEDLATIEAVTNQSRSDQPLELVDYSTLTHYWAADLTASGTPVYYYTARPSGTPVVATYPSNGDTIGVQYWKVTADLVDAGDEPESPAEAHYTIVDIACRRAYRDQGNHEMASAIQQEINLAIAQLRVQYPPGVADGGSILMLPSGWDW